MITTGRNAGGTRRNSRKGKHLIRRISPACACALALTLALAGCTADSEQQSTTGQQAPASTTTSASSTTASTTAITPASTTTPGAGSESCTPQGFSVSVPPGFSYNRASSGARGCMGILPSRLTNGEVIPAVFTYEDVQNRLPRAGYGESQSPFPILISGYASNTAATASSALELFVNSGLAKAGSSSRARISGGRVVVEPATTLVTVTPVTSPVAVSETLVVRITLPGESAGQEPLETLFVQRADRSGFSMSVIAHAEGITRPTANDLFNTIASTLRVR